MKLKLNTCFLCVTLLGSTFANADNQARQNQIITKKLTAATKLNLELNVDIVSNNSKPIIKIKSNLPKGTVIAADIINPILRGGTGYGKLLKSSLSIEKTADIGPFSQDGAPVPSGFYMVALSIDMLSQPKSVTSIIGKNGELLKGDGLFMLAGIARMVWLRYVFELTPEGEIVNFNRTKNTENDSSLIPIE